MPAQKILAIESSCDECAAAVVDTERNIFSDVIHTQIDIHKRFGGVVPEVASREHIKVVHECVQTALERAKVKASEVDAVAVTQGPGLAGPLMVGVHFAKGFALAREIPLIGVHHLEGHIQASSSMPNALEAPFVALIVSGGHTSLLRFDGPGRIQILGQTLDDAAGEAFDKSAKLMGLGYPGGREVDERAERGDPQRFVFPIALRQKDSLDFSFSGVKTSLRVQYQKEVSKGQLATDESAHDTLVNDMCACLRRVIVDALILKTERAVKKTGLQKLVIGGGVSANSLLRSEFMNWGARKNIEVQIPEHRYCTDNAVMIGLAAIDYFKVGSFAAPSMSATPSLPLPSSLLQEV